MNGSVQMLLAIGLSAVLASACNSAPFGGPTAPTTGRTTMQPLADAESVRVLSSINMGEVSAAQALLVRSRNDAARGFADRMITEHGQAEAGARELAAAQGITPVTTETNRAIDEGAAQLSAQIATGALDLIDSAYLSAEVDTHQQALSLIDCSILPGAQNPAYKTFVESTVRPMVQAHLDLAQSLAAGAPTTSAMTSMSVTMAAVSSQSCIEACTPGSPGAMSQGVQNALCR